MKRLVSLALALLILLTLAVPAFAVDKPVVFTDRSSIQNYNEVMLLVDLGLLSGYGDASFRPENPITRAETAKLMAMLRTDDMAWGKTQMFTDIDDSWAQDYILYCAGQGIIGGSGSGLFRPKDDVTGRELVKMLLVTIGYDPANYVGTNWIDAVDASAAELGIYDGFRDNPADPVTRDSACLLIYNAMQCSAIDSIDADDTVNYVLDDLMNPKTYAEARYGLVRYTATVTGNECADLTVEDGTLQAGITRLAGHKATFAVSTDLSLLGRNVELYVRNGAVVGVPRYAASELYYTFDNLAELEKLCSKTSYAVSGRASYYYNYNVSTKSMLETLTENDGITVVDHNGDGTFDVLLASSWQDAVVVALEPLTIQAASGQDQDARQFNSTAAFGVGDSVQYTTVCNVNYIR